MASEGPQRHPDGVPTSPSRYLETGSRTHNSSSMKTRLLALGLAAALLSATAAAQHRIALQGGGKLVILKPDGCTEWEMPWGAIHDLRMLPNGNLMVQRGQAEVVEIEPSTKLSLIHI